MSELVSGEACACLRVAYRPEDVELENPVTKKMVMGKRERWLCEDCGSEFNRTLWRKAVVKQQQQEIEALQAENAALRAMVKMGEAVVEDFLPKDEKEFDRGRRYMNLEAALDFGIVRCDELADELQTMKIALRDSRTRVEASLGIIAGVIE